jgi:IS30 family transposase
VVGRRRYRRIPDEIRREVIRLARAGLTQAEVGERVDLSAGSVCNVLAPLGGVLRADMWNPSPARLSMEDRVEIALGLAGGESFRAVAARIGRHAATVCREVNANGGRLRYKPVAAHRRAAERARRPKPTKLAADPRLRERVAADLRALHSPQQIARRLRADFGNDLGMCVSHETIYKSIYVQGRGELRRELAACLRTGRAARRPQGRLERRGRLSDMVMISERPAEVEDRAVPGHWEGDLILGANGRSAIGALVERSTRFVMLLHLPRGRTAEAVREAMAAKILTLPEALRRSITWDQGKEMAQHARFSVDTGVASTSVTPTAPGNAAATRTPTVCSASTSPRARACDASAPRTSTRRRPASTDDPVRLSGGRLQPRSSTRSLLH